MYYKYPFTKQDGLKNCACACMQMIIKYYKGYISLEDLSSHLNTDKNGTSAFKIIEVFKSIGFSAEGIKTSLDEINKENIILPAIAHVVIDKSYNHYITIYQINNKKKYLLIADPNTKIKKVTFEEFNKIWSNVLIITYPIKPVVKNTEVRLVKVVLNIIKNYEKSIIELFFMSLIYMITTISFSFYLKLLFDLISSPINYLLFIFIFFMLIYILKIITNYLRTKLLIFINEKIDISINMDVYKKVLNLPYQYYRNRTTGEIISKISDLEKIRQLINNLILTLFMDLPLTIFSAIVLYILNTKMFLLSIIVLIFYVLIFIVSKHFLSEKTDDYYEKKAGMTSYMYESINGFETVKGLNIENKVIRNFEEKYVSYLKKTVSLDNFINNQNLIKEIVSSISEVIIMYYGILLVINGTISFGTLIAFNSISMFFFSPIRNIISLDLSIEEAKKAIKKVYEMFENDKPKLLDKELNGDIKISNLSYIYNYDNKVLKNINLSIKEGEKVVITGKSGSGKSTLLKIIMKYYDVKRDKVIIGNDDINDIENIRSSISYISQNEILFTDSLYNNINLDNNDSYKFIDIVKDCFVDEIIKDNKLGFNMIIEENGFNISGGQRQRIILSRVLLSKFNILLIDEGLNQVDVNLERKILKNIFERFKEKTIIFISHRLENLDLYDHLIELEDGVIKKDKIRCEI